MEVVFKSRKLFLKRGANRVQMECGVLVYATASAHHAALWESRSGSSEYEILLNHLIYKDKPLFCLR